MKSTRCMQLIINLLTGQKKTGDKSAFKYLETRIFKIMSMEMDDMMICFYSYSKSIHIIGSDKTR